MPTVNESERTLFYRIDEDDEWVPMLALSKVYIDMENNEAERHMHLDSDREFHFTINISNKFHMSKKRYKKILMGRGISRNDAGILCDNIKYANGAISYREVYLRALFMRPNATFFDVWDEIYSYYTFKILKETETDEG